MQKSLSELRADLVAAEQNRLATEMSDDFAYTNGSIDRCQAEIRRIKKEIAAVEQAQAPTPRDIVVAGDPPSNTVYDESDWLGGGTAPALDVAKLADAPRPGQTTQTRTTKAVIPFDKTSPHFHPCAKCNGSGTFRSYSGRAVGACRACNGKGGFMRSVPYQQAVAIKARKEEAKKKAVSDGLIAFAKDHPEELEWMHRRAGSFEFAASMLEALRTYGHLTEKQLAAVTKCVAGDRQRKAEAEARIANAPAVETGKLEAAFRLARENGLKNPIMRFVEFKVKEASAASKNAGALYVLGYGEDEYFGKIVQGKFLAVRSCPEAVTAAVIRVLADPLAEAVLYGQKTGRCSCCGAELTNPESIRLGIGPICRSKFGI